MRSTENINSLIKRLQDNTTDDMDNRILTDVYAAMPKKQTAPERPNIWSTIMHSKTIRIAAGFLIVFGILFGFNFIGGPATSAAFANAMEKFTAAQTAAFDLTIEFKDQNPQTSSFLYTAPGYIRQNMANGVINIVDYTENKVLSLDPETMTAKLRDVRQHDFNTALYDIFTKMQEMLKQASELADGPVESLGTAIIENRTAYGFKLETTGQSSGIFWQGKGTLTIWADAETDFPLQLQWYNTMTNIKVTVSNIGLDIYIDPANFDFDLPEGYIMQGTIIPEQPVQPNETPSLDITNLIQGLDEKEQTLIKLFHSFTVLTKGKFPTSLTIDAIKDIDPDAKISFKQKLWSSEFAADLPNLFAGWKPDIDPNDFTREEIQQAQEKTGPMYELIQSQLNEKMQAIKPHFANIAEGFKSVNELPSKSKWNYNGKGANLGDADTAIFWYKPKGSKTYRAIYGDLKIEDVEQKDLHLIETPSDTQIDNQANELMGAAIQLGALIPKDKRNIVFRMLSLKEKDLIKGLATYLEYSDGNYPPSMEMNKAFMKDMEALFAKAINEGRINKKTSEEKVFDIFFAGSFYGKLKRQKKKPEYYGDSITINDPEKILVRWKLSSRKERIIYANLKAETVEINKK